MPGEQQRRRRRRPQGVLASTAAAASAVLLLCLILAKIHDAADAAPTKRRTASPTRTDTPSTSSPVSAPSKCDAGWVPGMSRRQCQLLVQSGCQSRVAWVGPGCASPGTSVAPDGGCQKLSNGVYCGFTCASACAANSACVWIARTQTCAAVTQGCSGVVALSTGGTTPPARTTNVVKVRVADWSQAGVGEQVNVTEAPLRACGLRLYATAPYGVAGQPDLSELEVRVARLDDSSLSPVGAETVASLYLSTASSALALADASGGSASGASFYSLTYVATTDGVAALSLPVPGVYRVRVRFPQWQSFPLSLLSTSASGEVDSSACVEAWASSSSSSSSFSAADLCASLGSRSLERLLLDVVA